MGTGIRNNSLHKKPSFLSASHSRRMQKCGTRKKVTMAKSSHGLGRVCSASIAVCAIICLIVVAQPASGFSVPSAAPLLRGNGVAAVHRGARGAAVATKMSANNDEASSQDWAGMALREASRAARSSRMQSSPQHISICPSRGGKFLLALLQHPFPPGHGTWLKYPLANSRWSLCDRLHGHRLPWSPHGAGQRPARSGNPPTFPEQRWPLHT